MFMGLAKFSGWNILYIHTVLSSPQAAEDQNQTSNCFILLGAAMQTQDQQEVRLLMGFRGMTQEEKNELLRFVIASTVRPAIQKPQLRVVNGNNDF
jgi:hypothetical protein